jgi:hypothetical protein
MQTEIVIQEFHGPTILEFGDSIENVTDEVVELRWTNTRAEFVALERYDRKFRLYVEDQAAMEKAATMLGHPLHIEPRLLENAKTSLTRRKTYDWRNFTETVGPTMTRSVILKLAADAVRKGKTPKLADIAGRLQLSSMSPIDADVLLRLKVLVGE